MEIVSGVFQTKSEAKHAMEEVLGTGVPADRVTVLTPGSTDQINKELRAVPVDTTEQPGMGKTVGAVLGAAAGLSGSSLLVAFIPGVGPITAAGMLGMAIVTAAGATIGATAGARLEESSTDGLPQDEIFVYEDALRKGKSVVIAGVEEDSSASLLRDLLHAEGAEAIDAAREQWWIGLRSSEPEHYTKAGRNFSKDEKFYRMGFEAALHARNRCREFDQISAEMDAALEDVQQQYPNDDVGEPFTRGYQRGREYYQQLCDESKAA